jgi:2-methylcitrate dehydratase PrpD
MTGPLLELGRRAALRLPEEAQEQARMHLFDALAAALAGAATREGGNAARHVTMLASGNAARRLRALAADGRDHPPAWAHSEASPALAPADIVLTLARRIRCTEMDDLQLESVTTAAAAAVPALIGALLVADGPGPARSPGSGGAPRMDEALGALAAGYDVMFTLGLAAGGPGFLYGQGGWPSLVGAGPAAAATTGRLLGLDAEGIAHAIALALLSAPRSLRGSGEDGRWLSFGLAVTAGFHAALAAAAGAHGDTGLLDTGLLDTGRAPGLFAGIGEVMERPWAPGLGLAKAHFKRWASAGQVAAAIDAVGTLQDSFGFTADDATAVDVHVPPAYRRMIDQPDGAGRLWSLLSAQYQIAVRLLCPDDLFDCARPVLRDSPDFLRAMRAVRVHDEGSLAAAHPRSYPARVEVTLAGGTVVDFLSDGRSPAPHWSWDAVLGKALAVAARTGTEAMVGRLQEASSRSADSVGLLTLAASLVS